MKLENNILNDKITNYNDEINELKEEILTHKENILKIECNKNAIKRKKI